LTRICRWLIASAAATLSASAAVLAPAAIAVFGNPSAKLGLPLTVSPVWGGRAIDLCNDNDPICQTNGRSVAAHRSYPGGATDQAANFVAGRL
jgi:cutinase